MIDYMLKICSLLSFLFDSVEQLYHLAKDRPYAISPQLCTWFVDASGICRISFKSNPKTQFRSILFNGTDIITDSNDTDYFVGSSSIQQYFAFITEEIILLECFYKKPVKINKNFTGFCELALYSNGFGRTKIPFQINVVDQVPPTQMPVTFPTIQPPASNLLTPIIALVLRLYFLLFLTYC